MCVPVEQCNHFNIFNFFFACRKFDFLAICVFDFDITDLLHLLGRGHGQPSGCLPLPVDIKYCAGPYLDHCPQGSLREVSGETFYRLMVKALKKYKLSGYTDTPWRSHLDLGGSTPAWKSLYKPPLIKRLFRILYRATLVNYFISVTNEDVEVHCAFCTEKETLQSPANCNIMECCLFAALFLLLNVTFKAFTEVFTKEVFICSINYKHGRKRSACS